ncbi:MAG TPA: prepilin-type N-terminal cleavage/methylation domain-containing protein [Phycisphaerae bacterium]|nr:prepilin-type N-terminal cleavage/methylation domain-containing protein [Phycisphaerae bacterium]HRW52268.1 prepilin-type N-terminal cleavage/methylation domain-containing protein [Phycisphaerae bacterium]
MFAICHVRQHPGSRVRSRGFTLIELLVVISIISLLLSILLPALTSARVQARKTKCAAELHAIGIAMASCQNEYNDFFPMWDDGERSTVNDRIIATWLDALKQRHFYGWDGGYCPADPLPDPLNEQRGAAWGFNYPRGPAVATSNRQGVDYSYGISIPLASAAHLSDLPYTYTVNGQTITESAKQLCSRNIDRRVLVGDAFWDWIHNMSAYGLRFGAFDVGSWYNNTAGYRHGVTGTRRPQGNFLMQDLHVESVTYDLSRFTMGVDTNKVFITYPGEPLGIYPALGIGNATGGDFPKDIDPYAITGASAAQAQWDAEIRIRKGWGV